MEKGREPDHRVAEGLNNAVVTHADLLFPGEKGLDRQDPVE